MAKKNKKTKTKLNLLQVLTILASGWLIFNGLLLIFDTSSAVRLEKFDTVTTIAYFIFVFAVSLVIRLIDKLIKRERFSAYVFICSLYFFAVTLCMKLSDFNGYIVMFAVLLISIHCFGEKYKPGFLERDVKDRTVLFTVCILTVSVTLMIVLISALRYSTYSVPNYDFGIFSNMFYYMKKTGLPVSSCERDKVLSHFAVHISPIFYLLLPIYFVFSSPVTLAVMQPIIIFSSLIPLYLLAKQFKLSRTSSLFILCAYALYAALSTGCFYDLHENCFLVPLILWMFFFFEKDKKIPMFVFALLVLLVKEDAFIYVAFFSLYLIISKKKLKLGFSMLVMSGVYFLAASYILSKYGLGIMDTRYNNLSGSGGLIDAAKTILFNPGYAISQVLDTKDVNLDKVHYIASMLCPLLFIPLLGKDFTRLTLVLPIFINLLTKYPYQYKINYQYHFGIAAFLFYLTLLNLSDMQSKKQSRLSFACLLMSFMLFATFVIPKCSDYVIKYHENKEMYQSITEALEIIPDDAEVTSSTYFLPHLTNREIIYEDEYHDEPSTEYFVLDKRQPVSEGRADIYIENGYELIYSVDGVIEIYQLKQ